jgi:methionyl-tRNA formyltransferase
VSTVFLGTSEFAAAILERLTASERHRPELVITRPDRPSGRGRRMSPPPVAVKARELGLVLAQPENVNDERAVEVIAEAAGHSPPRGSSAREVIVCAFGALIKEPLLSAAPILNVHPSLLPRWRGAAPIERAIMAGDADTGVSIMRLEAGLDSGPVCMRATVAIEARDTFGTLSERLQALGGELLIRSLEESPEFVEQDESAVTYAEKIDASDRSLDPADRAIDLERRVRALTPHIGARLPLPDGTMLGVRDALARDETPPGAGLYALEDRLMLACREGALELLSVQPPGGRAMAGGAYLRGHGLPSVG